MSREERRAYQRMMRNVEREPSLPPAARARAERTRAKREQRKAERSYAFSAAFWIRSLLIAGIAGLIGLSLQWDQGMPVAGYIGLAAGAVFLAIQVGFRLVQRRAADRGG
jgi:hypothetical protein